ncbi:MAG: hypothetical protein RLZZ292_613 [Bacteroidota bacterium]|jgi:protein-L-isoaspartate(D-aspartate) O-methyltransferase
MMQDNYRHKGMRRRLVEELRERGITDEKVLEAIGTLPRHFFLDKAFEEWAYQDKAFPIGDEQTISQPYTVAYQTSLLKVQKDDKVLEIGTGSGYQAAILALLGANVYSVERQENLYRKTSKFLVAIGFEQVQLFLRDGNDGLPRNAPFDKILVTAGATEIPKKLVAQLKINGRLVIPIGDEHIQKMYCITRLSETEYEQEILEDFRFVPFLKGLNKK